MSYSSEVLADSPLFYSRLGDPSGATMTDSSGNSHDGTYSNMTLGTTGLLVGDADTAITLNGTTSRADVTNGSWMNASGVTLEAVIKPTTLSAYHVIMARDSGTTRGFMFRINPSKQLEWEFRNAAGTLFTATGSTALSAGSKYHVAATCDGSNMKLWLNGAQDGSSVAFSGGLFSNALGIQLGLYDTGGGFHFYAGVLDEVAYYGTALSGTRLAAHYTAATSASVSATGSLTFSGSAGADAPGSASGALSLSGVATRGTPADGAGSLSLSGIAGAGGALAAAGSLSLSGSAAGAAHAAAAGSITFGSTAEAAPLYTTDLSNVFNGLSLSWTATATCIQATAAPPTGTPTVVNKAIPLPLPVLVKGRET